jgi:spermidine/putrescine transport system substrate-binding protein
MDASRIEEAARRDVDRMTRQLFLARMGGAALAVGGAGGVLAAAAQGSGLRRAGNVPGKVGGVLTFVGTSGEDGTAIAKPWLEKHHVTLKVKATAGNAILMTELRTGGTHQFDVITTDKTSCYQEIDLGFIQPLDLTQLHGFDGLFPGFQTASWLHKGGKTWGFPLVWGSEPCVWNPKKWSKMPPRYTDFADKKFAKSLTTIDEPYGNQWLVAKSLRLGENGQHNRLTQKELDQVRDAWKAIYKNVVALSVAYGDQTDFLVTGPSSIALNSWQAVVGFAKAKGVKLVYGNPVRDGTYYWSDSYFITSHSQNLATAYAYVNYMTSAENNAKLAKALLSGCTIAKARKLLGSSISAGYDYSLVQHHITNPDFNQSYVPPDKNEGNIVGKDAWVKSWEQVKA